jgi:hypothetical protein
MSFQCFTLLTDVYDGVCRHVMQQLVHKSVVFFVQLVLWNPDLEQFQVAHVLSAT